MLSLVASRPEVKDAAVCVIIGDDLQYALAVERAALRILECSRVIIRSEGMQASGHLQVAPPTAKWQWPGGGAANLTHHGQDQSTVLDP